MNTTQLKAGTIVKLNGFPVRLMEDVEIEAATDPQWYASRMYVADWDYTANTDEAE